MAMSKKDAHLYGASRPKSGISKSSVPSSNSFSSALSSLMSKPSSATTATSTSSTSFTPGGRSRSNRPQALNPGESLRDDLFKRHSKKRNASEISKDADSKDKESTKPANATTNYHASLDKDDWARRKRALEQKARIYAAMKRGDMDDADERYAVDFDRKWAEAHPEGKEGDAAYSDQSDSQSDDEDNESLIEYEDHLGRTRKGTRSEAARMARKIELRAEVDERNARQRDRETGTLPAYRSSNIIYGDTIQHEAFNPDSNTMDAMATLAAKRDRSLTPPPDTHYDSRQEIRNKGTGFFAFSTDEEERKKQMEGMENDRIETERVREERENEAKQRRDKRKEEAEERRKKIKERRMGREVDKFLEDFEKDREGMV